MARQKAHADAGPSAVYTAGYEGEAPESFVRKLRKAGVKLVIDVRKNAISRKPGFSKTALSLNCKSARMEYVHLPQLGVPKALRAHLKTRADYSNLMCVYRKSILPKADETRREAARLVSERPSALVCFEASADFCHRGCLATVLSQDTGLSVVNL